MITTLRFSFQLNYSSHVLTSMYVSASLLMGVSDIKKIHSLMVMCRIILRFVFLLYLFRLLISTNSQQNPKKKKKTSRFTVNRTET